jgi:hypothetical protein
MRLSEVLWCTLLDRWCINIILMHALSYPSRSTICKDRLPWVPLQLRVSQVDRAYPLSVHIISYISRTCQGIRVPYIPYLDCSLRINYIFVELTALRRTHGHVTVRRGSHCNDFGVRNNIESEWLWNLMGYPLDPGAKFLPLIKAHVMVAFGRMARVSTTTTSELALLRGYHPTKIRFRWHC